MTDATTLRQQRVALQQAEAQNDIDHLRDAAAAITGEQVDGLLTVLTAAATNLLDPVCQNNVANVVNVIINTRTVLAANIREVESRLPPTSD